MVILSCIDLATCLQYDNDVSAFLIYTGGDDLQEIRLSETQEMNILCQKEDDVLIAIACPSESICYVEKMKSDKNGKLSVRAFFEKFGVCYSPVSKAVWEDEKSKNWEPAKICLYEEGFVVLKDNAYYSYGKQ